MSLYHRILVPLDGSPTAERGLREAIGLARDQHATLHLVHVMDDGPMTAERAPVTGDADTLDGLRRRGDVLLARARRAAGEAGVSAQSTLREATRDTVAQAIVEETRAARCDLIVMGTHGRRGVTRLAMGSEAEAVSRTSPVPVLLVRQDSAPGALCTADEVRRDRW